jgi:hypothetical protein
MNRSTLMNCRARLILKSDIKRIADTEGDPAGSPGNTTSNTLGINGVELFIHGLFNHISS